MKKALWIINPCSGKTTSRAGLGEGLHIFSRADIEPTVYFTRAKGDAAAAAEKAQGYDMLVCCGGDGTLNEVINGLLRRPDPLPLGYIPSGTTNDFAASLGLSKRIAEAARDIVEGEPTPIDVGSLQGRRFSYIASFGAFTKASYSTPQKVKNAWGHLAYIFEGIKEVTNIKPMQISVLANGRRYEDNYLFGAVSNSTSVAGLFKLRRDMVDFSDGRFEVMLIRQPKKNADLYAAIQNLANQEYDPRYITFFHADKVELTSSEKIEWTLDGEYGGGYTESMVQVLPHALQLICRPAAEKAKRKPKKE